ncbi:MAG TPA: ABC transporter ATP-binding protein [Nevskiales bacterium]|nr:ABC transporter ATP-binding protein [Nevskiales bacterium]
MAQPSAQPVLISARGLTRRYGNKLAAQDISLELRAGDILGLLGPNGAGKSTTLRMLSGCLAPTSGSVYINGVDLAEDPKLAKTALGYLPEHPPVYPELTVDEYLRYCARLHGVPRARLAEALASAKRDCGLHDVGARIIGNLSKGYQQRVGLAQAIIHRPPVIILDEPTVGLDPIQIREIRKLIAELAKQHSVILSSHILSEIQATCSRVVIINRGRLVFSAAMAELQAQAQPSILTLGLRNPPSLDSLTGIGGVTQARQLPDGRIRLECAPGQDLRETLAERAVRNGWGLYELHAARKTLEEIFVELTTQDDTTLENAA